MNRLREPKGAADSQDVALAPGPERVFGLPAVPRHQPAAGRGAAVEELLIARERISMHVQPIVGLASGSVRGFEALARIDGGAGAGPADWLADAERCGRRTELELAFLRIALALHPGRPGGCTTSVNASPRLLEEPRARVLLASVEDPHDVVLELTENDLVEDYDRLHGRLAPLTARGIALAVDDVGVGHSSLRHVVAMRPRFLKLDRSLVRGLERDAGLQALIDALLGFTDRIGGLLVAEGVETEGELAALRRLGVPLAQGYALGRPAPPWPRPTLALAPPVPDEQDRGLLVADADADAASVHAQLAARADAHSVVIVDPERRPLGVLSRHRLLVTLGHRYGWALYARRAALGVCDRAPLIVAEGVGRDRLVAQAMSRPIERRYDPVLVVDAHRRLIGHRTIQDLLEERA